MSAKNDLGENKLFYQNNAYIKINHKKKTTKIVLPKEKNCLKNCKYDILLPLR